MDQYVTLQQGVNNDPEAVKKLQQTLYDNGYTQVGNIDGIYGAKTAAAVRAYQTDNQLQIDGIAGNETLSHLYRDRTAKSQTKQAPEVPQVEAPPAPQPPTPVEQARQELDALKQQGIQVNQAYEEKLQGLYEQIINRPAFSYNVNEDALFAQYADQYQRGGVLAMQDAMGQAAALSGGYGSSYAQSVGQHAYQQYMAGLADVVPALEQRAYDRYRQDRADQLEQYGLLWQQANDEYGKYMDQLQQQWQELDYVQGREDLTWQREQAQQQDAYSKLISLMSVGYKPTEEELTAAGMTQSQADAILKNYAASQVRYTGEAFRGIDLKKLPFAASSYQEVIEWLGQTYKNGGIESLNAELDIWEEINAIDASTSNYLYSIVTGEDGQKVVKPTFADLSRGQLLIK